MFEYKSAFARNLGWVTEGEQQRIKNTVVSIGGLGGVGGNHALSMARLGVEHFRIADFDTFDYSNFNRQDGAAIDTVGKAKIEITEQKLLNINPNIKVKRFDKGINAENIDDFFEGTDIYLDSLDIFAVDIRRKVFDACHKKSIPALTAAPLGMGSAFMAFLPNKGMSFKEYMGMKDAPESQLERYKDDPIMLNRIKLETYIDNIIHFIIGVAPSAQQRHYLTDKSKINFFTKDLPSVKTSMDIAAGLISANALKLITGRGKVLSAPYGVHFDAYHNRCKTTWRPGGHMNPLTKMTIKQVKKLLNTNDVIDHIIDQYQSLEGGSKEAQSFSDMDMSALLVGYKQALKR